jgi:hypothetical protein
MYVCISYPGVGPFDEGTLPSVAVHDVTGDTAAVTYFARDGDELWDVYATYWEMDNGFVSGATPVDTAASGEFELNLDNLLNYDWGTASSLVFCGADSYWATWSDHNLESIPSRVFGRMGYAEP